MVRIIKFLYLFYVCITNLSFLFSVQLKKNYWDVQRKTLFSIIVLPLFFCLLIINSLAYSQTRCDKALTSIFLPTISELTLPQGQGLALTLSSPDNQITLKDFQWLQKGRFETLRRALEKFTLWENKNPFTLISLLKITHNKKPRINYQSHELFQKKYARYIEETKGSFISETHPKKPTHLSFDAVYDFTTQVIKLIGLELKLRNTEIILNYDRVYVGYHPTYPLPSETFPTLTIHERQNFLEVEIRFELAKNLFLFIYYTGSRPPE